MKISIATLIAIIVTIASSCGHNNKTLESRAMMMELPQANVPAPEKITIADNRKMIKEGEYHLRDIRSGKDKGVNSENNE